MGIIVWILLSIVIAIEGKNRRIGFWWGLIACLLLSPLIGLIIVLLSEKKTKQCKYCGFYDESNAQFCPACGKDRYGFTKQHYVKIANDPDYRKAYLKDQSKRQIIQNEKSKKDQRIIIYILLAVIIVIVILVKLFHP